MAEVTTIARPYAEAVYRIAEQGDTLDKWSQMLEFASMVVSDPQMQAVIGNPRLTAAQQRNAFLAVCEKSIDAQGVNMVKLLLENGRLTLLPIIREQFELLRALHGGVMDTEIFSAYPLSDAEKEDLVRRLETKYKRKVEATVTLDPELIGGVRIVAGDVVIDASVRGQLQNMAFTLKS
ncbi:MAG: F0F1 ATP synthase subunit delta [Gammaproteobacteria bacterium]|nr:F0F1 ATP synthase subunit delta [Gammaproteobacteria bacterium]